MFFTIEQKRNAYEAKHGTKLSPTPHLHSHIEIVLIRSGISVGVADTNECEMKEGDLFIAFPNQIHYYLDRVLPVDHSILIVSPDLCPEFGRILKTMLPKSPVIPSHLVNSRMIDAIENAIALHKNRDEYTDTQIRGYLLVLFGELFKVIELTENGSCETDIVKSIINFCYENYDSDISLQSISDALHISRYYVSHLFSRKLHIGFSDYINSLRIRRACEMLKADERPITEIAYAVGYNSIRTFNRCFHDIMAMTPKEYRNRASKKKEQQ